MVDPSTTDLEVGDEVSVVGAGWYGEVCTVVSFDWPLWKVKRDDIGSYSLDMSTGYIALVATPEKQLETAKKKTIRVSAAGEEEDSEPSDSEDDLPGEEGRLPGYGTGSWYSMLCCVFLVDAVAIGQVVRDPELGLVASFRTTMAAFAVLTVAIISCSILTICMDTWNYHAHGRTGNVAYRGPLVTGKEDWSRSDGQGRTDMRRARAGSKARRVRVRDGQPQLVRKKGLCDTLCCPCQTVVCCCGIFAGVAIS